jgi:predicted amidophosphoribosyltransferase
VIPQALDEPPKCPVCQARFRGSGTCSRCGADLDSLILLIAKAYQLRDDARRALQTGDFERAWKLAVEAQATCFTQRGEDLRLLSSWLVSESDHERRENCPLTIWYWKPRSTGEPMGW